MTQRAVLFLSVGAVAGLLLVAGVGTPGTASPPALPLAEEPYVLSDPVESYRDAMMSGGPPPDGIPSIDEPVFLDADEADLDGGALVIGYVRNGEARAYPHEILVHHEIVNDRVADQNIAITYCPLTATAQGFERGSTTLGVSGQLLNSNLVMYDRGTESYFPQIPATGIRGDYTGETLVEVELVWTTWDRWSEAYPDTKVLSRDTGYLRNYDRDPYGSYNPRDEYYANDRVIFPLMHRSEAHPPKTMVVGARTPERSAYFVKDQLAREGVQTTDHFLAVYHPGLDVGYVYARSDDVPRVSPVGDGRYEVDGIRYAADELPMDRHVAVQGFFFAWNAFYPESETP